MKENGRKRNHVDHCQLVLLRASFGSWLTTSAGTERSLLDECELGNWTELSPTSECSQCFALENLAVLGLGCIYQAVSCMALST